jgi:hypothetical protein
MNVTFDINHLEIEVRSDGAMIDRDPTLASGNQGGNVSLMVHRPAHRVQSIAINAVAEDVPAKTLVMLSLTPNRARAIGSALLTAAQEARSRP